MCYLFCLGFFHTVCISKQSKTMCITFLLHEKSCIETSKLIKTVGITKMSIFAIIIIVEKIFEKNNIQ